MPDADQVTTAKAVVTALNAASLSLAFTAARAYRKRVDKEDVSAYGSGEPVVTVVGNGRTFKNAARRISERDCKASVVIQQRVSAGDNQTSQVDALQYFVQEVCDLLEFERKGDAGFLSMENDPIFDPTLLSENLFESVITLTYRVDRED